ncbi:MAG: branched-chain amino acid ABC transporter permease [Candidatus Aminicenantes bacterium]|nr:branched-chain amino acid ABC transporter permease [Candidatus Aminicenantes bacterium]
MKPILTLLTKIYKCRYSLLLLPFLATLLFYLFTSIFSATGFSSINYPLHMLLMINIYIILGFSVNLVTGYTGLLSLGHGALYGISAYITVLGLMVFKISFFPALILAILFNMAVSLLVSLPSIRLKQDYFVLAVIGFQMVVFTVLYNWTPVTRGPYGIPGIPRPNIPGLWNISEPWEYVILSYLLLILVFIYFSRIDRSSFGRVIKGIRDDELVVESMGRNVNLIKAYVFALSAGIAAFAGALFATSATYIDPTSFTLDESIAIIMIIFIGGSGNLKGVLWGAIFVELLPEILRFVQLPDAVAANLRQIIFGLLLIILMRFKPTGFAGDYDYD